MPKNAVSIRPISDRIVVKQLAAKDVSEGGILLPDNAKEKPREGTVIAVGGGRIDDNGKLVAMTVKVGDRVMFGPYGGSEVVIDGEKHLIMHEGEVFGVMD